MLKLNPLNRVRPIELGLPKGAQETFNTAAQAADDSIKTIKLEK